MARGIQSYLNILYGHGESSDYPAGRSKDDDGSNNGTPVNEFTLGDYQQFFAKLLREAGISANGLPESEYNTHQYFLALRKACLPYSYYKAALTQSGTNAPTPSLRANNTLTGITWARTSAGVYTATKTAAFASGEVDVIVSGSILGFVEGKVTNANVCTFKSLNTSGVAADDIFTNISIEIQVY